MIRVAMLVLAAMAVLALGDNFLRSRSGDFGAWQFMALRMVVTVPLVFLLAWVKGAPLKPRAPGWVALRSLALALAMAAYFSSLGFMTVPMVVAGFFTAPLFVLLFSHVLGLERIGLWQVVGTAFGFLGVLIALRPDGDLGLIALMPVAGGMFYAVANLLTRHRCQGEGLEVLLAGAFAALGVLGVVGLGVIAFLGLEAPAGTAGFALRGWVAIDAGTFAVIATHGIVAVLAMIFLTRAYLDAPTSHVAPLEYAMLPMAAIFGLFFGDPVPEARAMLGMAMILLSGVFVMIPEELVRRRLAEARILLARRANVFHLRLGTIGRETVASCEELISTAQEENEGTPQPAEGAVGAPMTSAMACPAE